MIIETKPLNISEELKRKIEFICKFANVNYTLTNGNIVDKSNIIESNYRTNFIENLTI